LYRTAKVIDRQDAPHVRDGMIRVVLVDPWAAAWSISFLRGYVLRAYALTLHPLDG
jgi:hypothetical protein